MPVTVRKSRLIATQPDGEYRRTSAPLAPALVRLGKSTAQPQGPVEVDWSNALTKDLFLFYGGPDSRHVRAYGTAGVSASSAGGAHLTKQASGGVVELLQSGNHSIYNGGSRRNFSAIVVSQIDAFGIGKQGYLLSHRDGTNSDFAWFLDNGSPYKLAYVVNGTAVSSTNNADPVVGRPAVYGTSLSWSGSTYTLRGYQEGRLVFSPSNASGGTATTSTNWSLLARWATYPSYTYFGDVMIFGAFGWFRELTPLEFDELYKNPWQLVRPRPQRIYVGA